MDFVQLLLTVLLIGSVAVAFKFWNQILNWAINILCPWLRDNLPWLEQYVKDAFWALDQVVTPIRNMKKLTKIKHAWKMLREYLLQVLVQFEQKTPIEWVKRITYWVRSHLKPNQVARVVVEEMVDADSLEGDVRKEWVKRGNTTQDIDVTQMRDRQLELAMTNSN